MLVFRNETYLREKRQALTILEHNRKESIMQGQTPQVC